jgi:polar amino acid transport system substrate-binding protein
MVILTVGISIATYNIAHTKTIIISTFEGSVTFIAEKVMDEAYRRLGMTLELKKLPAERSLQIANNGDVDGELHRKNDIDKSYPNLIVIQVPIVNIDEMIFTKNKKLIVKDWNSLLPYKIGYRIGIKVIEENLVNGTKTEVVPTLEQLFLKLDMGRNDVVIETRFSGLQTIAKLKLKNIIMLDRPIVRTSLFHCLNVKNKDLVEPLTGVLKKMEKEGMIQAIQIKAEQQLLKPPLK